MNPATPLVNMLSNTATVSYECLELALVLSDVINRKQLGCYEVRMRKFSDGNRNFLYSDTDLKKKGKKSLAYLAETKENLT